MVKQNLRVELVAVNAEVKQSPGAEFGAAGRSAGTVSSVEGVDVGDVGRRYPGRGQSLRKSEPCCPFQTRHGFAWKAEGVSRRFGSRDRLGGRNPGLNPARQHVGAVCEVVHDGIT